MYYGELKKCDIANGIGVRVSLFVSGCTNRCKNCFQPQTWDFCYGKKFTEETVREIYAELDKPYVSGLSILGGEPFEPANQGELLALLRNVKARYPGKTVWIFTGFRLEDELCRVGAYPCRAETSEILSLTDILVDGRYVDELHNISLQFRGSSNQRIIDMRKTRANGRVTLWADCRR